MAEESGFLSRWSQRKAQARRNEGPTADPTLLTQPVASPAVYAPAIEQTPTAPATAPDEPQAPPLPTMDDVAQLTHDADFTRFVKPEVSGEVRNAALKKLFTDPHFNVMDGLDTYIDDYNKPDPLPASMLRKMAQASYLGLVQPEDKEPIAHNKDRAQPPSLEPSAETTEDETISSTAGDASAVTYPADAIEAHAMEPHDENPNLRLQSLHDPGPPDADPRPGGDSGRQC